MFQKLGCLFPLTFVLVLVAFLGYKQGLQYFLDEDDWQSNYEFSEGRVVDFDLTQSLEGDYYYTPIVSFEFKNQRRRAPITWEKSYFEVEDEYIEEKGKTYPIWISKSTGKVVKPRNTGKNATIIINMFQGFMATIALAYLWWLRIKKQMAKGARWL